MNKQFIEDLKSCSFLNLMLESCEVVFIYIGGSRLLGITDEHSDYDLNIVVNNYDEIKDKTKFCLEYEGKHVHYYMRDLKAFVHDYKNCSGLCAVADMQFKYVDEENIIYINEKYSDAINFLLKQKLAISYNGAINLSKMCGDSISEIIQQKEITEKYYSKFIYHLCIASYILFKDEMDVEFLKSIKRIRWQPVSDEYKEKAVDRLMRLKCYVDTISDEEIESSIKDIKNKINIL